MRLNPLGKALAAPNEWPYADSWHLRRALLGKRALGHRLVSFRSSAAILAQLACLSTLADSFASWRCLSLAGLYLSQLGFMRELLGHPLGHCHMQAAGSHDR